MRTLVSGTVALVVFCAAGCSSPTKEPSTTTTSEGQKTQGPPGTAAAHADTALVRFINADPSAKSLNVVSNAGAAFNNVAYRTITPYQQLQAHAGRFELREPGGTKDLAVGLREIFPGGTTPWSRWPSRATDRGWRC